MTCPSCHQENAEDLKFCGHCGTRLSRTKACSKCGFDNPNFHRFCGECGTSLSPAPAPPPAPAPAAAAPPQPSEEPATPTSLAASRMTGERRQVAVLFADVVGFTAMSESMDPENVTDIMNRCFESLEKDIKRYDGTIDKYMGDCVLAVFGAPISHENDVELALRAALQMRDSLTDLNQGLEVKLNLSLGVTAGEVIAGEVGGKESKAYTVMGDTVNVAQRLQGAAAPGEILVSAAAQRLTRHLFEFEQREPVRVKGKAEPVPVYALQAVQTTVLTESTPPPLIGRTREWNTLRGWAEEVIETRKGKLVAIVGEAGIGKSRLKYELKQWLRERNIPLPEGRAERRGEARSYAPFVDMLRQIFSVQPEDSKAATKERLEKEGAAMGLHSVEIQSIGELLAVEFEEATFSHLDAKGRKTTTFLAVRKVVSHLAAQGPHVLLFEDLQSLDKLSFDLLEFLLPLVETQPLLIVCLYRPTFTHTWDRHEFYQRIYLKELLPADTDALVEHHAKAKIHAEIKAMIREKTQGNPLYVEEVVRTLREEIPDFAESSPEKLKRLITQRVPTSVQGIVATRMDRLSPDVKFALQAASVIGREFSHKLILRLLPVQDALEDWLTILAERGFIYERPGAKEREFVFKHTFVQDVAYRMLLQKHRAELHSAIAEAIEELYKEQIEEYYERLAHHCQEGGQPLNAAAYWLKAGDRSRGHYDNERATIHYNRALALIEKAESKGDASWTKRCAQALLGRGLSHQLLGHYDDAARDYEKAGALAREVGDSTLLVDVLDRHAEAHHFMGAFNQAIVLGQQGLEEARRTDYKLGIARCLRVIGIAYHGLGDAEKAQQYQQEARTIFEDSGNKYELASVLSNLGVLFIDRGEYLEALAYLTESLHILDELQDKLGLASCYNNIASLHRFLENFEDAVQNFEESHALSLETGSTYGIARNLIDMGELYIAMGEKEQAEHALAEALRMAREDNLKPLVADAMVLHGVVRAQAGERNAVTDILEGIHLAETLMKPNTTLWAKYYLGELYREWGDAEKASRLLTEAAELAQKIHMFHYENKSREALAAMEAAQAASYVAPSTGQK